MRLTPSWFHRSDTTSDEGSAGAGTVDPSPEGAARRPPPTTDATDSNRQERATEFVPESDSDLVAVLGEMDTPATVDEVVDHLVGPAHPSVETWADVHERLHRDRLPVLDSAGAVDFDPARGIVALPDRRSSFDQPFSRTMLVILLVGLLFVFLVAASMSLVTAVAVALVIVP